MIDYKTSEELFLDAMDFIAKNFTKTHNPPCPHEYQRRKETNKDRFTSKILKEIEDRLRVVESVNCSSVITLEEFMKYCSLYEKKLWHITKFRIINKTENVTGGLFCTRYHNVISVSVSNHEIYRVKYRRVVFPFINNRFVVEQETGSEKAKRMVHGILRLFDVLEEYSDKISHAYDLAYECHISQLISDASC